MRCIAFLVDAVDGTTFRYSTHAHYDNVNSFYEGRLQVVSPIASFAYGPGRVRGAMEIPSTAWQLLNPDGALDTLGSYSFDEKLATIQERDPVTFSFFSPYGNLAFAFFEQPLVDRDTVALAFRDMRQQYLAAALPTKYAGTNTGSPLSGIEGTAEDLKGRPKPRVLGQVYNITPNLVNTDRRIYQVDGQLGLNSGFTITVYDKRAVLTQGANYTSQADMEANVPAAGQYRVWPAGGCFRLGSAPVGRVTCDVLNPMAYGVASNGTISKIILDLAFSLQFGGLSHENFLTSDYFSGVYLNDEVTMMEAIAEILESVNGYILVRGFRPNATGGNANLVTHLTPPNALPYTAVLSPVQVGIGDIVRGSLQQIIPSDGGNGLPVWRVNLSYKKNYTVMSESDLAGVAAADVEFCKREYRTVVAEDSSIKTAWPKARELNVKTLLLNATDAQAEANRLLACFGARRYCYKLRVPGQVVRSQFPMSSRDWQYFQIGSVVNITYPRFGLDAGKQFFVIGMEQNLADDWYDLTVWG